MAYLHQIMLILPTLKDGKPRTVTIYREDIYGLPILEKLSSFLHVFEAHKDKILKVDPKDAARSTSTAWSYLHNVYSSSEKECYQGVGVSDHEDFRKTSPNMGVTIIDVTGPEPKYAIIAINGLKIVNYRERIRHPNDPDHGQELWYTNFLPITPTHWVQLHYGSEWKDGMVGVSYKIQDTEDLLKRLNKVEMLSVLDLGNHFPKMVSQEEGRGIYVTPNTLRYMDLEPKPIEIKATTKSEVKIKSKTPRKQKLKYV